MPRTPTGEGSGRPRKPTRLKVLHGDREDRINRAEPLPTDDAIEPPYDLTPAGRQIWNRIAPDRIAQGVLTAWDIDAFRLFCEALAQAHESVTGGGRPFREAVATCMALGGRFGWTPSDRAKLVVGGEKRDAKERLLS